MLQTAMPAISQGYVFSERYGADGDYATLLFAVTPCEYCCDSPVYAAVSLF
jgi:hypothetical protein